MVDLGEFPTSFPNVCIPFDTFSATTGAPTATTNFAAGDVQIYKNAGTTQRSSSAGITVSTSFDSQTGLQMIVIDLSDNTDTGFYAAGNEYQVAVADITADGQTLRFWAATFSIERAGGILALLKAVGTIQVNTVKFAGQTITAAAGVTLPSSVASPTNITAGTITTVTNLTNAPTSGDFTATMKTSIGTAVAASAVASVTARVTANTDQLAGQTVTAGAGVTFPGSVASPTNITAGTITTATNLTNAPTSGDFTATMKTSIGTAVAASAVASVTGNVGGNVVGSIGSVAAGGIAAASFAANAIDSAALAASAATEIATAVGAIAMVEPTGVPAVTATLKENLSWQLALSRNKITQTASTQALFADDGVTAIASASVGDDSTTFTRGEFA